MIIGFYRGEVFWLICRVFDLVVMVIRLVGDFVNSFMLIVMELLGIFIRKIEREIVID